MRTRTERPGYVQMLETAEMSAADARDSGNNSKAVALYERAICQFNKVLRMRSDLVELVRSVNRSLADCHRRLAGCHRALGNQSAADESSRAATLCDEMAERAGATVS